MSRTTAELLREASVHLDLVAEHAGNDLSQQLVVDAVCLRLAASLDVLNRLDPHLR